MKKPRLKSWKFCATCTVRKSQTQLIFGTSGGHKLLGKFLHHIFRAPRTLLTALGRMDPTPTGLPQLVCKRIKTCVRMWGMCFSQARPPARNSSATYRVPTSKANMWVNSLQVACRKPAIAQLRTSSKSIPF